MFELQGKYNTAKVFADSIEQTAARQIIELCNQNFIKGSKIRIMPDTHAGAGCTIGTTMTIKDKIVPNLVGVDIGCGMSVTQIATTKDKINFNKLDSVIRKYVPHGFSVRNKVHPFAKDANLDKVLAPINQNRAELSIGTLGGGNHFIEVNEDLEGNIYLVVHSGSRYLGKQIAEHYQNLAYQELVDLRSKKDEIISRLKSEGREKEISDVLKNISQTKVRKELSYLEGESFKKYLHDMKIAQNYAFLNRSAIANEIIKNMGWIIVDRFDTIHNYIDIDNMILRKGAISARYGEKVIIPINMRDGSIIAIGKGNADWNFSGPHGAGRLMSRKEAKETVALEAFKETMKNVWSTSVNENTLDESPFAYKPIEDITENVKESLDIQQIIKPLYNFKSN